ncbi:Uncharacterised protein [Vibrio cholerae]|nr:Uncharacterised protein [Vibrio cholerae]
MSAAKIQSNFTKSSSRIFRALMPENEYPRFSPAAFERASGGFPW